MGLVSTARKYIGKVKYVFGADDLDGGRADCSSFTQTIYEKHNITIGRDTEAQWTGVGVKIDKEDLKAGDLVFFKDTYNSNHTDGVSHVGIYSGNGKFIHCGSNGVEESSLNNSYYSSHYLGAKRVDGALEESIETETEEVTVSNDIGLKWWGDVVKVVLATLLVIAGVVLFVFGVKDKVKEIV